MEQRKVDPRWIEILHCDQNHVNTRQILKQSNQHTDSSLREIPLSINRWRRSRTCCHFCLTSCRFGEIEFSPSIKFDASELLTVYSTHAAYRKLLFKLTRSFNFSHKQLSLPLVPQEIRGWAKGLVFCLFSLCVQFSRGGYLTRFGIGNCRVNRVLSDSIPGAIELRSS